jgi:hypothetical protein
MPDYQYRCQRYFRGNLTGDYFVRISYVRASIADPFRIWPYFGQVGSEIIVRDPDLTF